jgi:hypothetical protein
LSWLWPTADNADGKASQEAIQAVYARHRQTRNAQQRKKFLAADFKELVIDQTLLRLEKPHLEPGFRDVRNCLVVWARPPEHVLKLAAHLQDALRRVSPSQFIASADHRGHSLVESRLIGRV